MNKFVWGNVNDPDIHMDEYNRKQINIMQARYMFTRLSQALLGEGEKDKAIEVADKMFELFRTKPSRLIIVRSRWLHNITKPEQAKRQMKLCGLWQITVMQCSIILRRCRQTLPVLWVRNKTDKYRICAIW